MSFWQSITIVIVLLSPAVIIAYDVVAILLWGHDATITWAVQYLASKWHELPWFAAALFVWLWLHLFGQLVWEKVKNGN